MKNAILAATAIVCAFLAACGPTGETATDACGGSGGTGGNGGSGGSGGAECPFESECPVDGTDEEQKAACDDGEPGTVDRCVAISTECGGVCAHVAGECDSRDPQSVIDERCDDGNACTDGRCSEGNTCIQIPAHDGEPCPLGTCDDGVCVD